MGGGRAASASVRYMYARTTSELGRRSLLGGAPTLLPVARGEVGGISTSQTYSSMTSLESSRMFLDRRPGRSGPRVPARPRCTTSKAHITQ